MLIVTLRVLLVFAFLLGLYLALDGWLRRGRRLELEQEHAAGAAPQLTREDYVSKGLADYERSFEKRVLYGIFALPLLVGLILLLIAQLT
jgi:hypothetical protein